MYKSISELCAFLNLDPAQLNCPTHSDFAIKVPLHFAQQIEKGNPNDPLLKQVLPSLAETEIHPNFSTDPVGDLNRNPSPSLIHKYQGRALLITSPRCDIHCRYCFRQHFPYEQAKQTHWQNALDAIQQDNSIEEVILSGGDPFTASEAALVNWVAQIEAIKHITTLRIHSRTPIAAPDKSPQTHFIEAIKTSRLKCVLVVHCNHPNELSEQTLALMQTYRQAGMTLLNQSVLLKGVNDRAETLVALSKALFQQGILPYYCHLLDRVAGSAHFEVTLNRAQEIMQQVRTELPGYLVPQLVQEIAGEPYKTPVPFLETD